MPMGWNERAHLIREGSHCYLQKKQGVPCEATDRHYHRDRELFLLLQQEAGDVLLEGKLPRKKCAVVASGGTKMLQYM